MRYGLGIKCFMQKIIFSTVLLICCYFMLFSQNLNNIQKFNINNDMDTTLTTENKTIIKINKNTFDTNDIISVEVEEAYDKKGMVLSDLSTETDGGVLLSGGMIKIEAYSGDEKLKIIDGKNIQIRKPAQQGNVNMDLYVLDSLQPLIWNKSGDELELDSCDNLMKKTIWGSKKVTKKEYRIWKKDASAPKNPIDRLFGGKKIAPFSKKEFYIDIPIDTIWECQEDEIAYYEFNMRSLGWYNIDKLKRLENPINFKIISDENLDVFVLLPRQNVCLKGKEINNHYLFPKLEKGISVTVLGYKLIGNNQVECSIQDIILNHKEIILKPSEIIEFEEFERILDTFK